MDYRKLNAVNCMVAYPLPRLIYEYLSVNRVVVELHAGFAVQFKLVLVVGSST